MENYWVFCMREIKVIGLILPLVLRIKVTLLPWTPDRLATSKPIAQASDSSEKKHLLTHSLKQASVKRKRKQETVK